MDLPLYILAFKAPEKLIMLNNVRGVSGIALSVK